MATEKIAGYVARRQLPYLTKAVIEELITFDYGEEFGKDPEGWLSRARQACGPRWSVRCEPANLHVTWLNAAR